MLLSDSSSNILADRFSQSFNSVKKFNFLCSMLGFSNFLFVCTFSSKQFVVVVPQKTLVFCKSSQFT